MLQPRPEQPPGAPGPRRRLRSPGMGAGKRWVVLRQQLDVFLPEEDASAAQVWTAFLAAFRALFSIVSFTGPGCRDGRIIRQNASLGAEDFAAGSADLSLGIFGWVTRYVYLFNALAWRTGCSVVFHRLRHPDGHCDGVLIGQEPAIFAGSGPLRADRGDIRGIPRRLRVRSGDLPGDVQIPAKRAESGVSDRTARRPGSQPWTRWRRDRADSPRPAGGDRAVVSAGPAGLAAGHCGGPGAAHPGVSAAGCCAAQDRVRLNGKDDHG